HPGNDMSRIDTENEKDEVSQPNEDDRKGLDLNEERGHQEVEHPDRQDRSQQSDQILHVRSSNADVRSTNGRTSSAEVGNLNGELLLRLNDILTTPSRSNDGLDFSLVLFDFRTSTFEILHSHFGIRTSL